MVLTKCFFFTLMTVVGWEVDIIIFTVDLTTTDER